jgi:hypothetical protein
MRKPSAETTLRTARAELKRLQGDLTFALQDRDHFRRRATIAEQEAAEWRRRFDLLLSKVDPFRIGANTERAEYAAGKPANSGDSPEAHGKSET